MPLITIKTMSVDRQLDAEVYGLWAICRAPDNRRRYQVTHIPTGYSFLDRNGTTKKNCHELLKEIAASGLDWSFTDPHKMPKEIKRVGLELRNKYAELA